MQALQNIKSKFVGGLHSFLTQTTPAQFPQLEKTLLEYSHEYESDPETVAWLLGVAQKLAALRIIRQDLLLDFINTLGLNEYNNAEVLQSLTRRIEIMVADAAIAKLEAEIAKLQEKKRQLVAGV